VKPYFCDGGVISGLTDMDIGTYKYSPLQARDSIRLLVVQPARDPAAPLHGSLLTTTLSDCDYDLIDPYTALSYVWGTSSATGTLILDQVHEVKVTATLAAALRDMRDAKRPRRVWADALCINQQDLPERNHQVSLMGNIYRTAHNTIIHLGPVTEATALILQNTPRAAAGIYPAFDDTTGQLIRSAATEDLLQRPWFRRVWIFQELVLSRDPWVQCGSLRARWTDLVNLLIPGVGYGGYGVQPPFKILSTMQDARGGVNAGTMVMLLKARRGLGATDPKDFVYAQLGVAGDADALMREVPIDYSLSVGDVFGRTARYVLQSIGLQALINLLDAEEGGPRLPGLPSWAPDWRKEGGKRADMYRDNDFSRLLLKGQSYAYLDDPLILITVGYRMDVITALGPLLPSKPQEPISEAYEEAVGHVRQIYADGGGVWYSGDKNGQHAHVNIRGREEEHAKWCTVMGREWVKFLGQIAAEGAESNTADKTFLQLLQKWLNIQARSTRIYRGEGSSGLILLLSDYMNPAMQVSPLEGRRLARTEDGTIGVVPALARVGDVVASLAMDEAAVLLRRVDSTDRDDLDAQVRAAVLEKDLFLEDPPRLDIPVFEASLYAHDAKIEHCQLAGHCFFDGQTAWTANPVIPAKDITIFAMR
jgi:hypothetical protein